MSVSTKSPESTSEGITSADKIMKGLESINPVLPQVTEYLGLKDFFTLAGTAETLYKNFPDCAISAKNAVCSGVVAGCMYFSNDVKGAQKEIGNITKEGANIAKIGAFISAAAMVGVNFIPLGNTAAIASRSLGKSLGENLCKTVVTDKFEKSMAQTAAKAVEVALKKGEKDLDKLVTIQIEAISKKVEEKIESKVAEDLKKVLLSLDSRFCTQHSVAKTLFDIGFSKQESYNVAEELIKANVKGAFRSQTAKNEMKQILIESMTKSFNESFKLGIQEGRYGKVFKSELEKRLSKISPNLLDSTLKYDLLKRSDEVFLNGVEDGAAKGIEKGVEKAFKKFELDRYMQSLNEFRKTPQGHFTKHTIHGESLFEIAKASTGSFLNLGNTWQEPDWKARLRKVEAEKNRKP